jgi:Transcriptional regulators
VFVITNRNDVAKRAGVSGATVSRVYNSPDSVGEETREKVIRAAAELDYHPNLIASNFVKRVSGNIGVIIPHIPHVHIFSVYYFSELLSGIGEGMEDNGYNLMLFFYKTSDDGKNDYMKYYTSGKVDGCIFLGTRRNDEGLLSVRNAGYELCLVNNYIDGSGISYIDVDNISGSYEVVRYLVELGHRRIAFVNGPDSFTNSLDRFAGYKKALYESGIPFDEKLVFEGNYSKKSGYVLSGEIQKIKEMPTAVFAGNDRMAAGLVQGFSEKGMRIPEDISIVGYDDSDISTIVRPALTTVHIPFFEMGKSCVNEFVKQIRGSNENGFSLLIKPGLVIRESARNLKI